MSDYEGYGYVRELEARVADLERTAQAAEDMRDAKPDEWGFIVSCRTSEASDGRYLKDVTLKGGDDVWVWTKDRSDAWLMSRESAEHHAFAAFHEAEAERFHVKRTPAHDAFDRYMTPEQRSSEATRTVLADAYRSSEALPKCVICGRLAYVDHHGEVETTCGALECVQSRQAQVLGQRSNEASVDNLCAWCRKPMKGHPMVSCVGDAELLTYPKPPRDPARALHALDAITGRARISRGMLSVYDLEKRLDEVYEIAHHAAAVPADYVARPLDKAILRVATCRSCGAQDVEDADLKTIDAYVQIAAKRLVEAGCPTDYPKGLAEAKSILIAKIDACDQTYDPMRKLGLNEALRLVNDLIAKERRPDSAKAAGGDDAAK